MLVCSYSYTDIFSSIGIVALQAYALLCSILDLDEEAAQYSAIVTNYSAAWVSMGFTTAGGAPHYRLEYDIEDSWSLKYNIMYQRLLGMEVFNDTVLTQVSAKALLCECVCVWECR